MFITEYNTDVHCKIQLVTSAKTSFLWRWKYKAIFFFAQTLRAFNLRCCKKWSCAEPFETFHNSRIFKSFRWGL